MKFLYTCDIHGDINKYEKIYEILKSNNINNLVIGGDLLPKKADLRAPVQRRFINGYLNDYMQKLDSNNINFIGILGNDDLESIEQDYLNMISKYEHIHNIDNKKFDIDGISFIGFSKVIDTPFFRKDRIVIEDETKMEQQLREIVYINKCQEAVTAEEWEKIRLSYPKMIEELEKLPSTTDGNKLIYVLHEPPFGIGLDCCKGGETVGSKDVLKFIKNKRPYMTFHGHIHESSKISGKWYEKVDETICIQPRSKRIYGKYINLCYS